MFNFLKKTEKKSFTPGISGFRSFFSGKFFSGENTDNNENYERYVQRSIDLISQEVASAHLRLYKAKQNGEKEEILDHEFLKMWNNPNPDMTKSEILEHLSAFLDINGNSYLLKAKDGSGKTREIYPLRADWVKVVPSKEANPDRLVEKYLYANGGGKDAITLEVDDIVPIRLFSPKFFNEMKGKGTVDGAKSIIMEEKTISDWNKGFFERGAITSGVLEYDGVLETEEKAAVEAQWKQEIAGMKNNGSTPVVHGGMKYIPTQFTQRELAFIDQRKLNRDDIFLLFGVPKGLMMSEDVNLANARQALWAFTRFTVKPRLKKIEDALNRYLLPEFGEGLTVEFDNPVPEDRDAEIKEYQAAIGNWMTPNEIRAEEGLAPLEGGDQLTRPSAVPTLQLSVGESKKKDAVEIPDERKARGEKAWGEMLKLQMPAEGKYMASLKKYFFEQRNRVLKNLPDPAKGYGQKDTRLSILDTEEEIGIMVDILTPLQRELFEKQARLAQKDLGLENDYVITPKTEEILQKYNMKISKEVNATTETAISQAIADAVENGYTIQQLTEQINKYFDYADATRAERIARSETIRTSNAAMESAWKQSDVVEAKEWYTAEDERVCEYCSEMDGKTEDLGAAFFKKGDTFQGLALDYRDITEPPLHTSCRCVLLPVLK